ncbi:MAG TPA: hypothetical protein VHL77_07840, partial [Ferruginibacter sp.]|nr:hypothetical protein [Ferruginibacter sp.]
MNNSSKNWLKHFIILSISMFLIPTIADIISNNSRERNRILDFVANWAGVFQIAGVIFSIISGATFLALKLKEKRSKQILEIAAKDPIWNLESLKYHTRFIFYKVQYSLKSRNSDELSKFATPEFILDFNKIIEDKDNCFGLDIDITETRIICCRDYLNNNKDKFAGYIQ